MATPRTILFLCPHNAAKSILAAAYFESMASARTLDFRAASAGTIPDAAPSPAVVAQLQSEGIDVSGHKPRQATLVELASAHRVISLGCSPEELAGFGRGVDRWDDVPPASQDLAACRAAIRRHLEALWDELDDSVPPAAAD